MLSLKRSRRCILKATTMPMTTRDAVDYLLPPGTTLDDLSDRELGELFSAVVRQAAGDETDHSPGQMGGTAAE